MFDPYHKWLGIPPREQPPNHYRLLALGLFESDPEVIDAAANRQMSYIQQRATGEHTALSQKLLNELAAARLCLLDAKKRSAYDAELKAKLGTASKETTGRKPGSVQPEPLAFLQSTEPPAKRQEVGKATRPDVRSTPVRPPDKSLIPPSLPHRFPKILFASGTCAVLVVAVILWIVFGRGTKTDDSGSIADPSALASGDAVEAGKRSSASETATIQAGQLSTTRTEPEQPAIYDVEIEPSHATLTIKDNRGVITGTGKQRQIRIDNMPPSSAVDITASADGYKSSEQWLTPKPGTNEKLVIALEKVPPTGEQAVSKQPDQLTPLDTPTPSSRPEFPKGAVLIFTFDKDTVFSQGGKLHVRDLGEHNLIGRIHDGSITQGRVGDGLLCGGRTYIQIDGSFPKAAEPRTLAAWIKKAEGQWGKKHIITYGNGSNAKNRVFGIMFAGNTWRFYDRSGGLDTGMVIDENWHHHCVAYDGTSLKYYLDSKLVATDRKSLDTGDGPFVIGACVDRTVHFVGVIDEVALFDRALSSDEVGTLYQMGCTGIPLKGDVSEKDGDSSGSTVSEAVGNGEGKAERKGRPITDSPVEAGQSNSSEPTKLVPGKGWDHVTKPQVVRVDQAGNVPNPSDLPQYLHGEKHRNKRNWPVFIVNSLGDSSLRIMVMATDTGGALMECFIDKQPAERFEFPDRGHDFRFQQECRIRIPSGQHEIEIRNTGEDYVRISWYCFQGHFADPH